MHLQPPPTNHQQQSQQQQQQAPSQGVIQFMNIANLLIFTPLPFSIDLSEYEEGDELPLDERRCEERNIEVTLFAPGGNQAFLFAGEQADKVYHWYLMATGQARVQPV